MLRQMNCDIGLNIKFNHFASKFCCFFQKTLYLSKTSCGRKETSQWNEGRGGCQKADAKAHLLEKRSPFNITRATSPYVKTNDTSILLKKKRCGTNAT